MNQYKIKQLSIELENPMGQYIRILELLSQNEIRIIASTIVEKGKFGVLKFITDKEVMAENILRLAGIPTNSSQVIAIKTPNTASAIRDFAKTLSKNEVYIEYMYGFSNNNYFYRIIKASDTIKAITVCLENNIGIVDKKEIL